ncbi:porin [Burkholderia pseudomultivorans]|uniref:Outer membrane porin protein n=1 Tax=Burkholderia pseudomultivorans TaxID=1207504 RepID=A0ABU2DWE8_9BURK|nr:porin [Burkholderia pseudomultivorans]MDR8734905.1 Outer membrane porin protein [Burkholderia pseudomultivorans]MDR8740826.1 Outer membrane porin protein [Burkholderia pseudomultivorans]MDR8751914.1 Outer membrane porin protein [Burkholderia pseudomultivorans]MDR8777240.1 Outer membrane porin protein [Burkholderia pseudomultivorans]MDR8829058.1 Outer membrane porin protein [Burkholderia pseudomultivorans]
MNKKLLTIAILAATAGTAHAQSSVTLYGVIDAGISYVNHSKNANGGSSKLFKYDDGVAQGSRWGLRGTEDLGGGLKAIFVLENGFNSGTGALGQGNSIFGRQAYVGLSQSQYGTVTFGRQYSFSTDILGSNYSTGGNTVAGNYAYHVNDVDQLTSSRISNAVKFQSANYSGFTFGAMYGFSNSTDFAGAPSTTTGTTTTAGSSRAYSFGLNYANGPFALGAAYTDIRFPSQASPTAFSTTIANISTGNIRDLRSYGVGGRYVWGPATAWLLWTRTQFTPVTAGASGTFYNAYEGGLKYAITPALSAAAGYTYTNATQSGNSAHWNQGNFALDYALSKRTDVYGLVVLQKASGNNVQAQIGSSTSYFNTSGSGASNQIAARVGIRHKF